MATSLFDFLLETMPLAGVRESLEVSTSRLTKFADFSTEELRKLLRYLPRDQDYTASVQPLKTTAFDQPQPQQQLWGWTHQAAEPAKIKDVFCRVRDAEYATYKVLDSIEWGIEDPVGTFKNAVRVTNTAGVAIELPLTQRFVHCKWVAVAGYLPEDATPLWRLNALHDRSIIIAFVYDLDPTTSEPKPMREAAQGDPDRAAELEKLEKIARELSPDASGNETAPDDPALDTRANEGTHPADDMTWVRRICHDNFMEGHGAGGVVQGQVGEQCTATTGAPRILVVLSLTACRERTDFEPGGVIGTARFYPHVMVWANIPLNKLEVSIRYDRPASSVKQREGLPPTGHDCCKGNDAMDPAMNCLLVTDANKDESKIPGPTLPFFSNLFAYYRTEAFSHFGQERLHVVRTDRQRARDNDDGWIVRDIVGGSTSRTVNKAPRQGAFDSIHMAPKMKLVRVSKVAFISPGNSEGVFPVDRYAMGLDDIAMAPFCAHDCFHTHWRWGVTATAKWTLGWDSTGPYKVAGAPMVPLNQNVDIWLRSKNSLTYHVTVGPKQGDPYIMPGDCQVIMYHGSAYAAAITAAKLMYIGKTAVSTLAPPPWFLDDSGSAVQATDSWAVLYWGERLKGDFVPAQDGAAPAYVIKERTTMTDDGLRKAMDL